MEPGIQPGQEPGKKPKKEARRDTTAGITRPEATPADARAMKKDFPDKKFKQAQAAKDAEKVAAVKKDLGVSDSRTRKPDESVEAYRQRLAREQLEGKYGAPKRPSAVAGMQAGEVMSARKRPGEKIEPVQTMADKVNKLMDEYNALRDKMDKLQNKGFALFKKSRLNRMKQMETNLNQQVFQLTQGMEDKRDARAIYDSGAGYDARIRKEIRADLENRTAAYEDQIAGRVEARREAEAEASLAKAAADREAELDKYRPDQTMAEVREEMQDEKPDVTEDLQAVAEQPDVTADFKELEDMSGAIQARKGLVENMGEIEAGDDEPTDEEIAAQMAEMDPKLLLRDLKAEKAKDQNIGLEYQVTSPAGPSRFQEDMVYWGTLGDEYGELKGKKVFVRDKKDLAKNIAELEENPDSYQMAGKDWDLREIADLDADTLEFDVEEMELDEDDQDQAKSA